MDEFVKPADLFKKRRVSGAAASTPTFITNANNKSCPPISSFCLAAKHKTTTVAQSPMKCLNNFNEPSPTRKLPNLMRNPFNQPVKRRLKLGNSPMKRPESTASISSSPRKSPVKKSSRMFEMNDEDANLEPPRMKIHQRNSPRKHDPNSKCSANDWILKTRLKIEFKSKCKNWSASSTTTHKRHSGNLMDEDTPSKVNDKTISLEAVKNAATIYQHPYLPWLPLYPRIVTDLQFMALPDIDKKHVRFAVSHHPAAMKAMFEAWCESLDDLTNLLLDGKCPYFYMCSDHRTILFRKHIGQNQVQAFISPFNMDYGMQLMKRDIKFKEEDQYESEINDENTNTNSCNSQKVFSGIYSNNSQSNFNSFTAQTNNSQSVLDNNNDDDDDINEELGEISDDDDETSQIFLEKIGVSSVSAQVEHSKITNRAKSLATKPKSVASVTGVENVRKLIELHKTEKKYTVSNGGDYAFIPPTLMSPREFRLSTPQYPEVKVVMSNEDKITASSITASSSVVGTPTGSVSNGGAQPPATPPDEIPLASESNKDNSVRVRVLMQSSTFDEGIQDDLSQSSLATTNSSMFSMVRPRPHPTSAPRIIELRGPILPNVHRKLHKLLTVSDNSHHTCSVRQLDSSVPFGGLKFPS